MRADHATQTKVMERFVTDVVMNDPAWPTSLSKWDAEGGDWGWICSESETISEGRSPGTSKSTDQLDHALVREILMRHGFTQTPRFHTTMCFTLEAKHQIPRRFDMVTSANEGDCCICSETLVDSGAVQLPCEHNIFHEKCISSWLIWSRSCPLCRQDPVRLHVESFRKHKEEGNAHFQNGLYQEALDIYEACLQAVQASIVDRQLEADLYNNKSQTYIQLKEWKLALESAKSARSIPGLTNRQKQKAEFRMIVASEMLRIGAIPADMEG